MNRNYRGITLGSGEMIYGCLVQYVFGGDKHCQIFESKWDEEDDFYPSQSRGVEVHPESVGQSTGLKDKNGTETYNQQRLKSDSDVEYKIEWIELMAAFWVVKQEYPYPFEKYTAEIIPKLELIIDTSDKE